MPPCSLDWPQIQGAPQRTGYSSKALSTLITNAWLTGVSPERLHLKTHPIIAAGKVFI